MGISRILHRRGRREPKVVHWYFLALTRSTSSSWAFDRFRMEGNLASVEVGIVLGTDPNITLTPSPQGAIMTGATIYQVQPFRTGGGWTTTPSEHDFTFDLSGFGTVDKYLVVRGMTSNHRIWQLYATITGYSATRGINPQLDSWDFTRGKIQEASADPLTKGRLRFDDQDYFPFESFYGAAYGPVMAQEVNISAADSSVIGAMLAQLVAGGKTDGVLTYTKAVLNEPNALTNYNTLISRNWVINGPVPTEPSSITVDIMAPTEGQEIVGDFVTYFEVNGITDIEILNVTEGQEITPEYTLFLKLN